MSSGIYHVVCNQGSSFKFDFTCSDNEGNPIDLSGFQINMDVRRARAANSRPIIQLSTQNGHITTANPSLGEVRIVMNPAQTKSLPIGDFFYDLIVWQELPDDGDGVYRDATRLLEGNFIIRPGVTAI